MTNKEKIAEKLKELFALTKKFSFLDINLQDGKGILRTTDATLVKGSPVTLVSPDGTEGVYPDGDTTAADGSVISVKSGVVDAITPPSAAKANEKMEESATRPAAKNTTTATPNEKMDAAPAPVDGAPAEQSSYDDVEGGLDMDMLTGIITNLTDRIAALEGKLSDTSMTVEKMSAAPAAKPFNYDPFGENTIGSELDKYKAAQKSKAKFNQDKMVELSKKAATTPTPKAQEFKQNLNMPAKKNSSRDLFGGSFSIEGGK